MFVDKEISKERNETLVRSH
uniref:Uncharacterized protein n=1 Tax=Arundo donax TaxID=35708 RepID=A0A0A9A1S4_ARUDO